MNKLKGMDLTMQTSETGARIISATDIRNRKKAPRDKDTRAPRLKPLIQSEPEKVIERPKEIEKIETSHSALLEETDRLLSTFGEKIVNTNIQLDKMSNITGDLNNENIESDKTEDLSKISNNIESNENTLIELSKVANESALIDLSSISIIENIDNTTTENLEVNKESLEVQKNTLEFQEERAYKEDHKPDDKSDNDKVSLLDRAKKIGNSVMDTGRSAKEIVMKIPSLVEVIFENLAKIFVGGMLIKELWPSIKAMISNVIDVLKDQGPQIISDIWDVLKDIGTSLMDFLIENGPSILENLVSGLKTLAITLFDGIIEYGPTLLGMLAKGLANLAMSLIGLILEKGPSILLALAEGLVNIAWEITKAVVGFIPTLLGSIVSGLWDMITYIPDKILSLYADLGAMIWNGLKSLAPNFIQSVEDYFVTLWDDLKAGIIGILPGWVADMLPDSFTEGTKIEDTSKRDEIEKDKEKKEETSFFSSLTSLFVSAPANNTDISPNIIKNEKYDNSRLVEYNNTEKIKDEKELKLLEKQEKEREIKERVEYRSLDEKDRDKLKNESEFKDRIYRKKADKVSDEDAVWLEKEKKKEFNYSKENELTKKVDSPDIYGSRKEDFKPGTSYAKDSAKSFNNSFIGTLLGLNDSPDVQPKEIDKPELKQKDKQKDNILYKEKKEIKIFKPKEEMTSIEYEGSKLEITKSQYNFLDKLRKDGKSQDVIKILETLKSEQNKVSLAKKPESVEIDNTTEVKAKRKPVISTNEQSKKLASYKSDKETKTSTEAPVNNTTIVQTPEASESISLSSTKYTNDSLMLVGNMI